MDDTQPQKPTNTPEKESVNNMQSSTPNSPQSNQSKTGMNQMPDMDKKTSSIGPLVAIVIILLVIIVGGVYFWFSQQNTPTPADVAIPEETTQPQQEAPAADIESEFNTDEFDAIESEFESIDAEFEGETSTQ